MEGFQTFHPTGKGQIDSNYQNFKFLAKESDSVVKGYNWITTNIRTLLKDNEVPFITSKADPNYFHHPAWLDYNSPTGDQFRAYLEGAFTLETAFWGIGLDSQSAHGLNVYNAKGELAFHSGMGWMKVVNRFNGSAANGESEDHTVQDAVKNYFYLSNISHARLSSQNYTARGFKRIDSTTIRVGTFEWQDVQSGDPTYSRWENDYQLIEVAAP